MVHRRKKGVACLLLKARDIERNTTPRRRKS